MTPDYLWGFIILAGVIGLIAGMVIGAAINEIMSRLEQGEERSFNEEGQWHFEN